MALINCGKCDKFGLEKLYLLVCTLIMVISSVVIMVWLYWPDNIVVVNSVIKVDKHVYYPGDRITYTFSYCKTRKMPGTVVRSLDNSIRITFTSIQSDLPVGCHTINVSDLVIPDYVDAGKYHIEGTGEYEINPIRSYFNYWKSEEFEIIKK